jgi:hypothetical protein
LLRKANVSNQFLNIVSSFDLITPTVAYLEDFLNGPAAHFGIPAHTGWSTGDIKRILIGRGVRVWGLMLSTDGEALMFAVRKTQAEWAYYILKREGVPILYAPADAAKAWERLSMRKANATTPLDAIFDFLDRLIEDRR